MKLLKAKPTPNPDDLSPSSLSGSEITHERLSPDTDQPVCTSGQYRQQTLPHACTTCLYNITACTHVLPVQIYTNTVCTLVLELVLLVDEEFLLGIITVPTKGTKRGQTDERNSREF